MKNRTQSIDFVYTHKNPYHDRLEEFQQFVLRDNEPEFFCGRWNENVFERDAELCVEIGTGYGHFMIDYAQQNPHTNFVGIDYRFKRSFNLAKKLATIKNKNFRYLRAKGERLQFLFGENEVDKIFYFFPDPWPKTKHHKNRLFQEDFLNAAHKVLKPNGQIFIKTDHDEYAEWMARVIEKNKDFELTYETISLWKDANEPFLTSFQTKFEKIFVTKKTSIKGFVLKNIKTQSV